MTNKEMIDRLQDLTNRHGELDVFIRTDQEGGYFEAGSVRVQTSEGEFPEDWNMPAGLKFILID
jgi:hypothetical protein